MQKRWFEDDGKLIIHKKSDPTPVLDMNQKLRSAGATNFGKDNWHVARIPTHVLEMWLKEAGLRMDDREAVRDLIKRKLLDGDNSAFRIHEGSW